jgi:hypothetical protein
MSYYPDLEPCTYFEDTGALYGASRSLLSVGWLEPPHPFTKGPVDPSVLQRLDRMLKTRSALRVGSVGLYECQLCGIGLQFAPDIQVAACNMNSFVPGDGFLYMFPNLITHYMRVHGYAPPAEFCEAVLRCPPVDSPEYVRLITQHGPPELIKRSGL